MTKSAGVLIPVERDVVHTIVVKILLLKASIIFSLTSILTLAW